MKYYKTSKFPKAIGSTGVIAIVACALIAVGAIAWFALSRKNAVTETPPENFNSSQQEYNNDDKTYNNSTADTPDVSVSEPATDVNQSVSDVPYEAEESEPEIRQEKITYILPANGNISKGYSDTALQYSATYGDMRIHTGVDILCEKGSDIKSVAAGTVKSVNDDSNYGKVITVEHAGGVTVKYCGMGSINFKENDTVDSGDVLGTSGEIPSECADNPHIHIEVTTDGETVSPFEALGLE